MTLLMVILVVLTLYVLYKMRDDDWGRLRSLGAGVGLGAAYTLVWLVWVAALKSTSVIFVFSGYGEDGLPDNQQFAFLPKPFTLCELVRAVKETMSPSWGSTGFP